MPPPEIASDIEKVRDEVKNWASSLKAPKEWGSGETVNLKTKFCYFMRFGPNDELLSEPMEIGERLLQWSKDHSTRTSSRSVGTCVRIGENGRNTATQLVRIAPTAEHRKTMLA